MKKILVSDFKTFATLQINAVKTHNGSGAVGAGFKDVYNDFKTVRGKFEQKNGSRVLESGAVISINLCKYTIRYETAIMAVLDMQTRFTILHRGDTAPTLYTLLAWNVVDDGKEAYFVFELSQYGK